MKTRLLVVAGLLLSTTVLPAATIIKGVNFPGSIAWPSLPTTGDTVPLAISNGGLLLPMFNSNLGTLNSVTLTLAAYVDLTITFTNTTGLDQEVDNSSGDARVRVSGPASTFLQTLPTIPLLSTYVVPAGTSTRHGSGTATNGPVLYSDAAVLSAFSAAGGGFVHFILTAQGEQGSTTPTGVGAVPSGFVNGTLTAVYDYTPGSAAPEPATLMLFGSALLFLGVRWRKN